MSSQQFNLRWNNHTNNLIQVFFDQFEHEHLVDVTISCQGKFIKAHKMVLSACSPHFQDIFDQHGGTPHPVIIMNGLKYENVKSIVEFMYKGEVKVCESDLESLLAAAENLQIKGLSNVRSTRPASSHGSSAQSSSGSNSNSSTPVQHDSPAVHPRRNVSQNLSHALNNSSRSSAHQSETSNQGGESLGTPLHLRRKRAKIGSSPGKDVFDSPGDASATDGKNDHSSQAVLPGIVSPMEDESSNDLPMTIKIEPPYIRDIDEEDDDWEKERGKVVEPIDVPQDNKAMMEPKEKIPRPPNAFMIFANEWRRKLANQHPSESNKEISVRLGIMWKNLPGNSKEDYFAASRQANEDHKKKYPDYYYSPKEARLRKRWKMQQQHVSHLMSAGQYNPVHLVKVFINDEDEGNEQGEKAAAGSVHHNA